MADLALVLVMAIWGSTFALIRFFLSGAGGDPRAQASPLLFLAARMLLATALLLCFLLLRREGRAQLWALGIGSRGGPQGNALAKGLLLRDGLLVGALLSGGFLLQAEGLARTSASRSGFFTGLLVVFVPLLELILFRKRPPPLTVAGLLLAFLGMAALSGAFSAPAPVAQPATLVGDLLTVGCALVFAGHIIALGRVTARHPVLPLLFLQLACVGLTALAAGPLVETTALPLEPRLWATVAYLALFATLLAFGVQTWAQKKVTPVRLALLSALEPAFAALWAALLLGERLLPAEQLGGALVLAGVIVGELGTAFLARKMAPPSSTG